MSEDDNESIYPIANWDIGPIEEHQLVVFRPHFISSPEQTAEDAEISRYYALTLTQAKELKDALETAIMMLDKKIKMAFVFTEFNASLLLAHDFESADCLREWLYRDEINYLQYNGKKLIVVT